MSNVSVFWVSRHTDILSRGYFDEGLLEDIFANKVWTPPSPLTFTHHEVRTDEWPEVDGAIVLLPARHHASEEDMTWFVEQVEKLSWSLVILCGDESWDFDVERIVETPTRRCWTMQPKPSHTHFSGLLPGGFYPQTHELITDKPRIFDFFFGGQVTHSRREACLSVLRKMLKRGYKRGRLIETQGYLQGVPKEEYFDIMSASKVIPCPSGPMTVDTARPLEAMEAGCVPVVDVLTPRGEDYDYWSLVFGADCPLTRISDWGTFPKVLRRELGEWPRNSNRVFSFWQQWKRRITRQLHNDVKEVMQNAAQLPPVASEGLVADDLISVIVTTSPCAIHPSTDHITQTIDSIRASLPTAEIVVVCDGIRDEDSSRAADYNEYIRRLLWLCNFNYHNVVPIVMEDWGHQANATRRALDIITSPYILFVEHDTPITEDIPWDEFIEVISSGSGNLIQLHFNESIHPDHQHLLGGQPPALEGSDYQRTRAYWQRPHLASTTFYRDILDTYFPETSRTMIEDRLYGIVDCAIEDNGWSAWEDWKLLVYTPKGNMIRSRHLDSRGSTPKYAMWAE